MVKFMFLQKLFLTKAYLATLTDEQVAIGALGKHRALPYLNERCDRNFAMAKKMLAELRATAEKTQLVVPAYIYRSECAARTYAERRLGHWVDRAVAAEDDNAKLLDQIDSLRNERNELLDCVHDLAQALKAVAPAGE
jgi:hypothetical protein